MGPSKFLTTQLILSKDYKIGKNKIQRKLRVLCYRGPSILLKFPPINYKS